MQNRRGANGPWQGPFFPKGDKNVEKSGEKKPFCPLYLSRFYQATRTGTTEAAATLGRRVPRSNE